MTRRGRRGSCDAATAPSRARTARWAVAGLVLMAALFAAPQAAMAWKPFTHNFIGDQVWPQAANGQATVGQRTYPLPEGLAAALDAHQASYNGGVVGPDGFPDITFGQSQVHPNHTGKWLRFLMQKAQAAQSSKRYTAVEKARIRAFSYGFLTHAAGDMWGHTLINDFAAGVFPSIGDFTQRSKAAIALRHVIAESYVGSATPGWDRAQGKRREVCTTYTPRKSGCNISDDITPRVRFNAPTTFIYDIFVNPNNPLPVGTCKDKVDDDGDGVPDDGCPGQAFTAGKKGEEKVPEPQRGPLLDHFLDLQADLEAELAELNYNKKNDKCSLLDSDCRETADRITVPTIRGNKSVRVTKRTCRAAHFCFDEVFGPDEKTRAAYLTEWLKDIRDGLENWGVFSLEITKALFDPKARRDAQNHACRNRGDEDADPRKDDDVRADCESKIGTLDTIDYKTADFVNDHLFEMLGAPQAVGEARGWLNSLADEIDDWIGPALNPLRWAANKVKEVVATLLKRTIREATGLDVDEVRRFVTHPERWMCGSGTRSIALPGAGTLRPADLFNRGEHQRLDQIMGLPADHHQSGPPPRDCQGLNVGAPFPIDNFAAMKSSIVQANLLLLDGTQLNLALGDVLTQAGLIQNRTQVRTYPANGNVMFTPLAPATEPWLDLIDGDHAWRSDGLPRFCSPFCQQLSGLTQYPRQPITQSGAAVSAGGTGAYPVWESCVLRPAFRALFSDWENGPNEQPNFPDLGDATSPDPASDPDPPTITLHPRGVTTTLNGRRTVLPGATFQPIGHDDVFNESVINVSYRVYASGTSPGRFEPVRNRGSIPLPSNALAGNWVVEVRAEDPCGSSSMAETFTVL